jgi:hypothetical protein
VFVLLLAIQSLCFAQAPDAHGSRDAKDIVYHIGNMHQQPFFWEVVFASLVGWLLSMVKGFSGSKDWLEKYMSAPPKLLIFTGDLIIFVIVGGYVGTGVYNPSTIVAAFAAGISWPVGLGALTTK